MRFSEEISCHFLEAMLCYELMSLTWIPEASSAPANDMNIHEKMRQTWQRNYRRWKWIKWSLLGCSDIIDGSFCFTVTLYHNGNSYYWWEDLNGFPSVSIPIVPFIKDYLLVCPKVSLIPFYESPKCGLIQELYIS